MTTPSSHTDPALDPVLMGDEFVPPTERRLPDSLELDAMGSLGVLELLNAQDRNATEAVAAVLPDLAHLVEIAAERVRRGGSVHYFGAGTSGRLAFLDAAELLPTFNLEPDVIVAHLAGDDRALVQAVEDAEDSVDNGRAAASALTADDVAIGLTASGSTPYVGGALAEARARGAYAALVANNPQPGLAHLADLTIVVDTGAEVITGSTRLKAGTTQKLVLNGFSTALMVALGRTWSNLMVSVVATNEKLRRRVVRILMQATGLDEEASRTLLDACEGELKTAIVASLADVEPARARILLAAANGSVLDALAVR
ncbi:N-acetylmuramic acid 6-phosphate etherase [Microbacterium sp. BWT-B31]|uniref:N-acetylmuramic acid 6-phosphate etherase n=1 Tax=Microbacterium sp. BWT-B31 TaxID=3232072 RepID=UPI003527AF00